jgi:signal transduction histidine kinase
MSTPTDSRQTKADALAQLVAELVHELANPLTAVVARSALIASAQDLEDARRQAAIIEDEGRRATTILRTLGASLHQLRRP